MSLDTFKKSQLYTRKSKNLTKLGFDFNLDIEIEYYKIQSLLYSLYHIRCESMITIMKMFDIPSSRTMDILFREFEIEARTLSEATMLALETERSILPQNVTNNMFKHGWHKTWDGKSIFYRSSYELNFAQLLDKNKIKYDVECLRIKYFDSDKLKYRIAVPDFYLPTEHKIVEIKSSYWYNEKNMQDKKKEYLKLGFDFELILDGASVES